MPAIQAQERSGELTGLVMYQEESGIGNTFSDAHVTLVCGKDTLRTTSMSNGVFRFKQVKPGKAKLIITAIGCRKVERDLYIIEGKNPGIYIDLHDEAIQLREVTIKGIIPIVTQNGDTLIFNPAAINVQEGDPVMSIIEQLPGAETDETSVKIMGEQITKTYIDGKLIFGSNPIAALKNLSATDVLKIKAYDEYENTKTKKIMLRGGMTRVLNIETRSKLINSFNAHLLTSAGGNLDKENNHGDFRRGLGLTANFFSEKFLLTGNIFHNNINRRSNQISDILSISDPGSTYTETTYADLGMERTWNKENGTHGNINVSYTFGLDQNNTDTRLEQHYFPNANYQQRVYEEQNSNAGRTQNHHLQTIFANENDHWGSVRWEQTVSYTNDKNNQFLYIRNEQDYLTTSESLIHYDNRDKAFRLNERVSYTNGIGDRFGYSIESSLDMNKGKNNSVRLDTLQSSLTQTYLTIPSKLRSTQWDGAVSFMYLLMPETENALEFRYGFNYEDGWKHQFAWNMQNPAQSQIDEANTYSYKTHNLTHHQELSLDLYPATLHLHLSAGMKESTLKRNEEQMDNYRKTFISPTASFSIIKQSMTRSWNISYKLSDLLPNVVQLRPQVDNSNPYMLRSGNPNLKQAYIHTFSFGSNYMLGIQNHTLGIAINASIRQNSPVSKTTYYESETYLPELQYTASAHSSLVSFENVKGYWNATGNLIWQAPIRYFKSKYTVTGRFNYEHSPYYIETEKTITRTYDPSIRQSLLSNLTKNLKITIDATTRYIQSINTHSYTGKTFYQTAGTTVSINRIYKNLYLNSSYQFIFSRDYGVNREINRNHNLNLNIGYKILKRKGDISFAAYDLLNSHRTFSSQMYSNYIQSNWTNYYGRFFTFNFAYRFGKIKSNYSGAVGDGTLREYHRMP